METTGLRERNKSKRRSAIVAAAVQLFASQGYHQTTIPEIAELAELAPRTVAMHFPAKIDIVKEDIDAMAQELAEALESRQPGHMLMDTISEWIQQGLFRDDPHARNRLRMYTLNDELGALLGARISETVERAILADGDSLEILENAPDIRILGAATAGITRYLSTLTDRDAVEAIHKRVQLFLRGGMLALQQDDAGRQAMSSPSSGARASG